MKSILFALSLAITTVSLADSNDNYTIIKTAQTITIDGDLSEWSSIPATNSFSNHQTGAQGIAGAFAQMAWDDNNLYIAFTVTDADITANYVLQDANVFDNDDLVEMFFDFDGSGTNYLELGVSATGVNYDFNIICPGGGCGAWSSSSIWDIAGLEAKTIISGTNSNSGDVDNGYTVEIKIPLNSLSSMPNGNYTAIQEGSTWKGNLFKINYNTGAGIHSGTDYLSWSNHGTFGFHQPTKFATFTFGALSVGSNEIKNSNISISKSSEYKYNISSNELFSTRVYDTLGKVLFTVVNTTNTDFNTNGYPKGIYYLETIQNGTKAIEKILVK